MLRKALRSTPAAAWRWAFRGCAAAVLVLCLLPPTAQLPSTGWDKANHALAFAALALLGLLAHPVRRGQVLWGLLAYGALIEVLQSFTGYRSAEWLDLAADGVGIALGWLAARRWVAVAPDQREPA